MNFNFIHLSILSIILLVLMPNSVVFGEMNPWGLFQQMCQAGRFATGPQVSGNSPALTLIVSVITISLAVILFEVIPMKNIMSISTKQERQMVAFGFWRNLHYVDGRNRREEGYINKCQEFWKFKNKALSTRALE